MYITHHESKLNAARVKFSQQKITEAHNDHTPTI